MPIRGQKPEQQPAWYIGFIGDAKIEFDNAKEQLDNWLPSDLDINVLVATNGKRGGGLSVIKKALDDLNVEWVQEDQSDVAKYTQQRSGVQTGYLIALVGDDVPADVQTAIEETISSGTKVLSILDALEEIEISEAEEPKQYGQPRDGASIEIDGPATIAPQALGEHASISGVPAMRLMDALKDYVRWVTNEFVEDWTKEMGLSIGHNASVTVQGQKIPAYVDEDGNYEPAKVDDNGKVKRAPRGRKSVELSAEEAKEVGLI